MKCNPAAADDVLEALKSIVKTIDEGVFPSELLRRAKSALHMAQLPVKPSKEFIIKSGVVEDENGNRWRLGSGPLFAVVDSLEPLPVVPVSEDVETIKTALNELQYRILSRDYASDALASLDHIAAALLVLI